MLLCYAVPEKDYQELLKQVQPFTKTLKTIRSFYPVGNKNDIVRIVPTITEAQKTDYFRNYEQIAMRKYDVIKVKPKICEIADLA